MRSGRNEQATALAAKIGESIKNFNSAELSRTDVNADPKTMWAKVQLLTGHSENRSRANRELGITASMLNKNYANMPTSRPTPATRHQVSNSLLTLRILRHTLLNGRFSRPSMVWNRPQHTGLVLENWGTVRSLLLPCSHVLNLSLSTYVVPKQWKTAYILPIPTIAVPQSPADFRPISITPILSRISERIIVRDFIYPSLQFPHSDLSFCDQIAFQPSVSTTAALIHLLKTIMNLLQTNPYVVVYALDCMKAFYSVRRSAVLNKFSLLSPCPGHDVKLHPHRLMSTAWR